jgi:hypothetical protein
MWRQLAHHAGCDVAAVLDELSLRIRDIKGKDPLHPIQ